MANEFKVKNGLISPNAILQGSTSGTITVVATATAGTNTITLPAATGTAALTTNKLSDFASTTSSELKGVISDETGSGALVFATSPTLVTPVLGTPTSVTLTNATGLPVSTGISGLGTGVATFLGTPSSANLASAITDETGTGALVFANTPTLVTPVLGVATATSVNKVAITAPASSATLTLADGSTLATSGAFSTTFTTTNTTTLTLPTTGTLATLTGTETFANKTLTAPDINAGTADSLTSLSVRDTSAAFDVTISATSSTALTAGRTLTLDLVNAARSLKLAGNIDIAANFSTSGANAVTLTSTGATNVTLPTTGTLATTGNLSQFSATTSAQLAGVISDETGSGALVFANTPTLVTPVLGVATATSVNKVAITAPATGSTLTIADGKTLTASNTLTFTGTDSSSVAFGAGGTVAYTGNKLSDFASTTSSELKGVISDETGSGVLVFATSPTFTTGIDGGATFSAFASSTSLTLGYSSTAASTTNISTGAVAAATTKTINIGTGGAASSTTNINLGSSNGGTVTVNKDLVVTGDLTVNGTTITVNSTTITVDDKNIELGSVATPTNTTADGGGITLKGATDKTFNWVNATSAWTSSEHVALASGKNVLLNGSTSGTITLAVAATAGTNTITLPAATGTVALASSALTSGRVPIIDGNGALTDNGYLLFNSGTGALTAQHLVANSTISGGIATLQEIDTLETTFNLVNDTAETINFGGAATTMYIGPPGTMYASGNYWLFGGSNGASYSKNIYIGPGSSGGATNIYLGDANLGVNTTTVYGTLELGHASDTTLSRSSAGVLAVEGVVVPTISSTSTLTNKTLTAPVIDNIKLGYTTTATAAGTTTLTVSSNYYQRFTGTTTQTVVLPVTSTLVTGMSYAIENVSTGNLTVNSSGGNLVATVIPGTTMIFLCIGTTLTTAADWDAEYDEFAAITGTGSVALSTSPTFTTSIDSSATFGAFASSTSLTLGYTGTAASTTNISTGAVAASTTKTINIGTGGAVNNTTNINLGSSNGSGVIETYRQLNVNSSYGTIQMLGGNSFNVSGSSDEVRLLASGSNAFVIGSTGNAAPVVLSVSNTEVLRVSSTSVNIKQSLTLEGQTGFSISAAVTAAGSTQGTATALTKTINNVTTVAASTGVVLPTAVAGYIVIVRNGGANALNVYPATGAAINAGAANAAHSLPVGAMIQYVATSTTQWYTMSSTFA
jgi:hypothetical protein